MTNIVTTLTAALATRLQQIRTSNNYRTNAGAIVKIGYASHSVDEVAISAGQDLIVIQKSANRATPHSTSRYACAHSVHVIAITFSLDDARLDDLLADIRHALLALPGIHPQMCGIEPTPDAPATYGEDEEGAFELVEQPITFYYQDDFAT